MDDWLEDEGNSADSSFRQREFERIRTRYTKAGYREAYQKASEAAVQEGFNQGYKDAIQFGLQEGTLHGVMSTIQHAWGKLPHPQASPPPLRTSLQAPITALTAAAKDFHIASHSTIETHHDSEHDGHDHSDQDENEDEEVNERHPDSSIEAQSTQFLRDSHGHLQTQQEAVRRALSAAIGSELSGLILQ